MVKYNSKGNLPQNADYYALLNRSDADWRDTVRQGLVFSSAGAGLLNYGVRNLITTSTTKMRWKFKLNTVAGAGTTRYIGSQYNSGVRRSWGLFLATNDEIYIRIGKGDGTADLLGSSTLGVTPVSGDLVNILWESGIIKTYINGVLINTVDYSGTATTIYNQTTSELNICGYLSAAGSSYSGSLCCFEIWVDNILDTDTPKFVAPMGDKQGIDLISGTIPAVVGTVDMTVRADDASYDCEENGFAVQGGDIYSKNYAGTGYAGLVGDPDKIYYPGPYPNTFTGNWHELTHAYFDKSDTDIWEDYVRESINYISEEPNYWHVSELTQDFIDTYVKAAYADKIFVGLDATDSDYAGAVMVFESGITADQLKDLNFWRKRKYFPERV
ncbi:MAG: hypothetical protein WC279_12685 [Sulfurimonas sp.]|jgi:hypothetical protein|uniref:hypothetical protein n=1 Tax=Sulfurimonas sp. TaxID=2022749 RepID=UPI0035692E65